ncbi:MAG TPA: hypothetical protein VHA12_00615 [Candidatus Nanoarchaeia archaeon]|nr:hypothetical protein [Candidatus Nanoarchaeia archaeon]
MNKQRKGEVTLNEVISILIAVLIIAGIVYGIIKVASVFMDSENRNAKNTLDLFVEKLKFAEKGNVSFIVQGFPNSRNWFVAAWSAGQEGRPDKCYFDSCICVCPLAASGNVAEKCQSKGVCQKLDYQRVDVEYAGDSSMEQEKYVLPESVGSCEMSLITNSDKTVFAKIKLDSNKVKTG